MLDDVDEIVPRSWWLARRFVLTRVVIAGLWCSFVAATWRTQHFGFSIEDLASESLILWALGMPVAVVALLGLPWLTFARGLVILLLGAILLAEGWASLEEAMFQYAHHASTIAVHEPRWWPFTSNDLHFLPDTGAWFASD